MKERDLERLQDVAKEYDFSGEYDLYAEIIEDLDLEFLELEDITSKDINDLIDYRVESDEYFENQIHQFFGNGKKGISGFKFQFDLILREAKED